MLPVLACFLGGATQKWEEGLIITLLALYLLVRPPRFSLGTLTNLVTGATQSVIQTIQLPLASASSATCQILHLVLGPLDLSLLGLNVHLNQVVLDITATPGPGNLLGNLLCAVAHLLDGPGSLHGIAALLNNIIGRL